MKVTERLHCHNCDSYQSFEWDDQMDGRQIFYCPNCKHPHFRVISENTIIRRLKNPPRGFYAYDPTKILEPEDVVIEEVYVKGIQQRWGSGNDLRKEEIERIEKIIEAENRTKEYKRHMTEWERERMYRPIGVV